MSDVAYDPYALPADGIQDPPTTLWTALKKIGPGIVLAGSIVGSGELILTTSLGADWGFIFLWLILFSCVIKVFVQIELGRSAISTGKPTLSMLNEMPGPRLGANWQVWWWFVMLLSSLVQLGAMVGGVGQALQLAFPALGEWMTQACGGTGSALGRELQKHPEHPWAILTAFAAIALLLSGGYKRLERITTIMVASVTAITVACVLALPATGFPIDWAAVGTGMGFVDGHFVGIVLPADAAERVKAIALAFAVFGITGVGASELYAYPYFCIEKGYARFVGPRSDDPEWARRANGWMRVMHLDAWVSMIVFTAATVAFYALGATVLHRQDLHPKGAQLIETLAEMYVPAFGSWTKLVFLIGAWAVLFKTCYVATAAHTRTTADFFSLAGIVRYSNAYSRLRVMRFFCVFYPLLSLSFYLWLGEPKDMVKFGGLVQGLTLPVIAGAAIYLRYKRTDRRIAPSTLTDICLWLAFVLITLVASKAAWDYVGTLLAKFTSS